MTNSWRVVFRNCSLISLGKASVFLVVFLSEIFFGYRELIFLLKNCY